MKAARMSSLSSAAVAAGRGAGAATAAATTAAVRRCSLNSNNKRQPKKHTLRRACPAAQAAASKRVPPPPEYESALLGATLSSFIYEYRDEMGLEGDVVGTYKELMTRALDAPEPVASIDATTTSELTVEKDAVGIELVEFIATEDYKPNAAFKDTECAVFVSPRLKRIVVAFRGTESRVDWLGNLRATQRDIGDSSDNIDSEVHSGFRAAYFDGKVAERVEAAVVEQYEKHSKNGLLEDWGILTTGHSLGGALATLCLYRLAVRNVGGLAGKGVPIEMVNFGAPRVGNAAFCSELEASSAAVARVVNLRDAVCRIAPAWLTSYRHAGPFTKFDGEGQATVYSADEQRELGWGFSSDDHSMSTTDKNGNAYLNKLMALGQSGWPGRASA